MKAHYCYFTIPNAERMRGRTGGDLESVAALVTAIQAHAIGPKGQRATIGDIAALLDIGESTLESYRRKPRVRARTPRGVPFPVIYCLTVMAACPLGVAQAIWGDA